MAAGGVTKPVRLTILALVAALLVMGVIVWRQGVAVRKAEQEVALNTTRMLREVFVAKGDLRVGQLDGVVVASTVNDGRLFRSTQTTRAPATVNYLLDLSQVQTGAFDWDSNKRTLTVLIPDVSVDPPAVDMAKAEVQQNGIWISRAAGLELQKAAAGRIAARATERAKDPANLAKARAAARDSVVRLVRRPLDAVGYRDVEVSVRFPWETGTSAEQMDRSRSLDDVYANRF